MYFLPDLFALVMLALIARSGVTIRASDCVLCLRSPRRFIAWGYKKFRPKKRMISEDLRVSLWVLELPLAAY
jgi:hypothetical protein